MNLQRKVYRMNWPKLKSLATGRIGRTVLVLGAAGGLVLGGSAIAEATLGTNPGAVNLVPPTGQTSSQPTWQTTVACSPGFQGSAVFRAVKSDGTTTSISQATNSVATPFSGTLQAPLSGIQQLSNIPDGGTQEYVVICFSGPSLTGTQDPEMNIFVTYNADGTYATSDQSNPVPVGEIGGIVFAGLAAIGLAAMTLRRRSQRRQPSLTS